jgi:hypothetical protein
VNPLNEYPQARKYAYIVSFVVGLALGAFQVGFAAAEHHGLPTWLKVALAVYAFVAAGLGLTAAQNVPSYRDVVEGDARPPAGVRRRGELGQSALYVALLVLVILAIVFLVLGR